MLMLGVLLHLQIIGCKSTSKFKNITYMESRHDNHSPAQQLTVFAPRKHGKQNDVLIFIHGGNWNSGKKSLYGFLGRRLARKGIVAVVIDYPLSPQAQYNDMAMAAARSVQWVQKNIERYGGDPSNIFVSGHSAGGHLAALISVRNNYFDTLSMKNPIRGAILIDAAGLDMYGYLKEEKFPPEHTYMRTFTSNPNAWKAASPLYHLHEGMPPMLIYLGGKSYPSIINSNQKFVKSLKSFVADPEFFILKGKKHIPMITQFLRSGNPLYAEMIEFMKQNEKIQ